MRVLSVSFLLFVSTNAFSTLSSSGGRSSSQADRLSNSSKEWKAVAPLEDEAKLTLVQITDVYTLSNFASLRTMLKETRETMGCDSRVKSVLTGDFLAPYLLSSVDRGAGMMDALAETPVDYLTWGNHEADIDHKTVCKHVRNFPGTFINSNMQDHEAMDAQVPFEIVEITSPDGSQTRKIGLIAVLSDDPALYSHFKAPGAFGGATIRDPWETLAEYQELLEGEPYNCDLIVPLQHLYVPDDHKTCRDFNFPVILSGHDHHRVDETIAGTRLLKPGLDGIYATVVDISWKQGEDEPTIDACFVPTSNWAPDEELHAKNTKAYNALAPLKDTELARVPPTFEPLSSVNARGQVTTMGMLICSLLRSSLNVNRGRQRQHMVDAVLLMGGNIRAGEDYEDGSFFSLEALEAEIKDNEVVGIVRMPGRILAEAIAETHSGDPIPGWLQYDSLITETKDGKGDPLVTHVGGMPIDMDRIYRVATKVPDLTNGQSQTLTEFYTDHPECLPSKGAYVNIHAELMSYFARNMWRKVWEKVDEKLPDGTFKEKFELLDLNSDGVIDVPEIHSALRDLVELSVHEDELSLADFVKAFADADGDGKVTLHDFIQFGEELPKLYEMDRWRLAFARPARARKSLGASIEETLKMPKKDMLVDTPL